MVVALITVRRTRPGEPAPDQRAEDLEQTLVLERARADQAVAAERARAERAEALLAAERERVADLRADLAVAQAWLRRRDERR